MSRIFLTPVDMNQNELQNARIQNLGAAPTSPAPVKGQVYMNSSDNTLYYFDGTVWKSTAGISGVGVQDEGSVLSGSYTAFQFSGSGVTAVNAGGNKATVTIPGVRVLDEGAARTPAQMLGTLNFIGAGVTATVNGPPEDDQINITIPGGGAPSGAAGGDLTGTYPNPTIGTGKVTTTHILDGTVQIGDLDPVSVRLDTIAAPTSGSVSMNGGRLTTVAGPVAATDAANKNYVDTVAQGLDTKQSVYLATTANSTLTGALSVDGVVAGNNRILVKNQTNPAENGIYNANNAGAWTRANDMDAWAEVPGAFVFVEQGSTQADTGWVCTADVAGGVIGTTAMPWTQFSGAGAYAAGSGLTQSGTTFNVGAGNGITVNADDVAVTYSGSTGDWGVQNAVARADHSHLGNYVPLSRAINTTAPLTGGGNLTADRTLAITSFAGSTPGAVPTSPGGSTQFLRADGTWSAPSGGGTVNKYAADVGGATSVVLTHGFSTRDVNVQVYRNSTPWDQVECDVERNSTTQVTLRFATAPAAAAYRAVVTA